MTESGCQKKPKPTNSIFGGERIRAREEEEEVDLLVMYFLPGFLEVCVFCYFFITFELHKKRKSISFGI